MIDNLHCVCVCVREGEIEGQGCMFLCFSVCVSLLVCKFSPSLLCNLQPSIGALSGAGHMDASFSPPSLLLLSSFATSFNFCTPNLYFLSSFSSPPSHPIFPSLQFSMSRDAFFNCCTPLPLFSPSSPFLPHQDQQSSNLSSLLISFFLLLIPSFKLHLICWTEICITKEIKQTKNHISGYLKTTVYQDM